MTLHNDTAFSLADALAAQGFGLASLAMVGAVIGAAIFATLASRWL